MENISIGNNSAANPSIQASLASAKTETEQATQKGERVVATENSAKAAPNFKNNEEARFEAVKAAAAFVRGENAFLSDIRFTIHKEQGAEEYVIRFTNVGNGAVTVSREQQVLSAHLGKEMGTIMDGVA